MMHDLKLFMCLKYKCKLTEEACGKRHYLASTIANSKVRHNRHDLLRGMRECLSCDQYKARTKKKPRKFRKPKLVPKGRTLTTPPPKNAVDQNRGTPALVKLEPVIVDDDES